MRELLRRRAFVRFWCARLAGTAASQILMLALGWHMYDLTESAWDLGLVGLCQFGPALGTTLIAGHAADRFHRARLVALGLAVQGAVAIALVAATQGQWMTRELLLATSLLLGGVRPFHVSAQQALVPTLVPPQLLARALAISSAGVQASVIGGPALGGVIFMAGVGAVYGTCAGLFLLAALMCLFVRYEHAPSPREPVTVKSLLAGVSFIWSSRLLLGAVSLDLFAVLLGGATALLPLFAKEILHVGPSGLGLLRAAPAVGAMAMTAGGFHSPLFTVAWPSGEFGAMGLEGAVKLGYRKELEALPEGPEREALYQRLVDQQYANGAALHMAQTLEIDAVIDPADTRRWLARGLASANTVLPSRSSPVDSW